LLFLALEKRPLGDIFHPTNRDTDAIHLDQCLLNGRLSAPVSLNDGLEATASNVRKIFYVIATMQS
jgi:hypothetical protein